MDRSYQITGAADGRTLAFAEWGDLSGYPVFALHGTPGCRLDRHPDDELVRSTGARVISYDRPGYGGSDRHRGRAVADAAGDVAAIADHLGIGQFSVYGASGGGPHALAVAALLGDRVSRAACIVGVAPFDALDEELFTGMDPENVKEWRWALQGEERLAAELPAADRRSREQVIADRRRCSTALICPRPTGRSWAARTWPRSCAKPRLSRPATGYGDGPTMLSAFVSSWEFDPAAIAVPTLVWYGTQDVLTPPGHGEWIARTVPGAVVRLATWGTWRSGR